MFLYLCLSSAIETTNLRNKQSSGGKAFTGKAFYSVSKESMTSAFPRRCLVLYRVRGYWEKIESEEFFFQNFL